MIGFVTWPPLLTMVQKRWPGDKANHTCEKYVINYCSYVIQERSLKDF